MPIEKRWVVKPQGNPKAVAAMAAATGISPVLANLLVQRGIDTLEKAKKFFNPQLSDLHDPFLMKDMDKAVGRGGRAGNRRGAASISGVLSFRLSAGTPALPWVCVTSKTRPIL